MVVESSHLLERADRSLSPLPSETEPRQADLRRAISDCYYAVFHFTVTAATDNFFGMREKPDPQYQDAYRKVRHSWLRDLCEQLQGKRVSTKTPHAPHLYFSGNVRKFATIVTELYEFRERADYDPSFSIKLDETKILVDKAKDAVALLQAAPDTQRVAFLTLLLFDIRDTKRGP